MIFVFGSNIDGVHGAGAARTALLEHGAVMGEGWGLHGNSFAIPTVILRPVREARYRFPENRATFPAPARKYRETMPLAIVKVFIDQFLEFANAHAELEFQVTRIGCGLAGFDDEAIAPLFRKHHEFGDNCLFDSGWAPWLPDGTRYWGTYDPTH